MKFIISGTYYKDRTFPGLNEYIAELGRNPHAGGRLKRDYMMVASNAIRRDLKRYKANDDPSHMKNTTHEFEYTSGVPRIEVTIEEL